MSDNDPQCSNSQALNPAPQSTKLPLQPKLDFLKSQALITAFTIVVVKYLTTTDKSTFQIPL